MSNITRRQFIKGTVAVGTACIGFPSLIRAQGLNEKLQVGFMTRFQSTAQALKRFVSAGLPGIKPCV